MEFSGLTPAQIIDAASLEGDPTTLTQSELATYIYQNQTKLDLSSFPITDGHIDLHADPDGDGSALYEWAVGLNPKGDTAEYRTPDSQLLSHFTDTNNNLITSYLGHDLASIDRSMTPSFENTYNQNVLPESEGHNWPLIGGTVLTLISVGLGLMTLRNGTKKDPTIQGDIDAIDSQFAHMSKRARQDIETLGRNVNIEAQYLTTNSLAKISDFFSKFKRKPKISPPSEWQGSKNDLDQNFY